MNVRFRHNGAHRDIIQNLALTQLLAALEISNKALAEIYLILFYGFHMH